MGIALENEKDRTIIELMLLPLSQGKVRPDIDNLLESKVDSIQNTHDLRFTY